MRKFSYAGYRFPPEIIRQAIWLYLRFTLSLRDVEDLLAERGIIVSYETVRRWVNHFGPMILPTYEVAAQSLTPLGISTRSI
jgi:putative transposase